MHDGDLTTLAHYIQKGWPDDRKTLPFSIQAYFPIREELSLQNGVIFKGERVVVPTAMRAKVMNLLHQAHTGIDGTTRRAREVVYWPRMYTDLESLVRHCQACQTYQRSQPREPMISHEIPERPWQM